MTNVLVIAPTPFFSDRGCHVRIYEVTRSLARSGFWPLVLTYPIGNDIDGVRVCRAAGLKQYQKVEAGPAWPRLFIDTAMIVKAAAKVRKTRPAFVYAFLHEGSAIAGVLRALYGVPFVFDYQGSLTMESLQHGFIKKGALEKAFRAVERRIDAFADVVVTSADSLGRDLKDRGLDAETVPDGVDIDRFSPALPDKGLKEKLGLPEDLPVLVYLGVMSEYQGVDVLLEAALILKNSDVSCHFLLMGYPEGDYRKKAETMGLGDCVTFTGRVDYGEAPDYLRTGAVGLAPKLSRTESNGKVLNYMACGLPVVAFDTDINRELLGDCAIWATPDSDRRKCAENFAGAVSEMLDAPDRARHLAQEGRRRAIEHYSLERQAEKLKAVCDTLCAGERNRRERLGKKWRVFVHQFEKAGALVDRYRRRYLGRGPSGSYGEARHWSVKRPPRTVAWQDHPVVQKHVNTRVSGRPDTNWLADFLENYCGKGGCHALNLGCGFGDLEAHAFAAGKVSSFDSLDLSPAAVEYCKARFRGLPATFTVSDLDRLGPLPASYDVVFAASVLHHVVELPRLLDAVYDSLVPGGWFVFDEYVGPSRFQWRPRQLEVVNGLLSAMPIRLRRDLRRPLRVKRRVYPNPLDERSRDSPYEAVRSEEILKLVSERFTIVRRRDYGGAILHPLLDGIAGNFRIGSASDMRLLYRLLLLERELEKAGEMSSDFTSVVARRD